MTHESAIELLADSHNDMIVAMQSAYIEWKHGGGAEAAMSWIENTLDGPGLIPDEGAPYGKEAQAWFDANNSTPMPACECGRPSNIMGCGVAGCCLEHYDAAKNRTAGQDALIKDCNT